MDVSKSGPVQVLLYLLRLALFPEDTSRQQIPEETDWDEVYSLASVQTVRGLALSGLGFVDGALPSDELLDRWAACVEGIERRNRTTDKVLVVLDKSFRSSGIFAVLKKGQSVARMYPEPEQRECGDIDLFIPDPHQRRRAVKLAEKNGSEVISSADGAVSFWISGVEVELQPCFTDLHREPDDLFPDRDSLAGDACPGISLPEPEAELLMLSSHILKHSMGLGVGLRQLCDMAVACRFHKSSVSPQHFYKLSEEAGLLEWHDLLFSFLVNRLGLPKEYLPYEIDPGEDPDILLRLILRGGNFGRHAADRVRLEGASSDFNGSVSRKTDTFCSFVRNLGFSWRYGRRELFPMLATLAGGNVRAALHRFFR